MKTHDQKVKELQLKIKALYAKKQTAQRDYGRCHSHTTYSKKNLQKNKTLACGHFDKIIEFDPKIKRILVEPRMTMDALVKATLKHGLVPPVVPEFKGITVGGAIMGAAAESNSHHWGIFHDTCTRLKLLTGAGQVLEVSPANHSEIFHGISGSYGSLGLLVAAEIELIPAYYSVELCYHVFDDPQDVLKKIQSLTGKNLFLDGILFSPELGVVIEGRMMDEDPDTFSNQWYAERVQNLAAKYKLHREKIPLYDYLFRYDQGAFWMGAYLYKIPFLWRYIQEGLCKINSNKQGFTQREIDLFKNVTYPNAFLRNLTFPLMKSQRLWGLLHRAKNWVENRMIIQDFCIPEDSSVQFLTKILKKPAVFPIWVCPLKGTQSPQIFAPHYKSDRIINFGVYGCPAFSCPTHDLIRQLENLTQNLGGRKVLYSFTTYTDQVFWSIYPKADYENLRLQTQASPMWPEITTRVLSSY